ncbi:hypothetical protein [Dyella japonica]|uniref:Uncharacterized protein n=1 Tax=Dyella japonica A8 TaxID=1217721 RepID=A0A075K0F5_9GAMM|nr:hypothetical protein [Dyella japonica]AIF47315.1 hypothetical protein HY57_08535 [Dyella japonica A8]
MGKKEDLVELNQPSEYSVADEVADFNKWLDDVLGSDADRSIPMPEKLLLDGFYIEPVPEQASELQLWVHQTGVHPSNANLDGDEARMLASLIELVAASAVSEGSLDYGLPKEALSVKSRYRGAICIALYEHAPRVTIPRERALALATSLRSAAAKLR